MKSGFNHTLLYLALPLLMMGCSTSLPLSEAVIFAGDEVHRDSLEWHSSFGFAYTSNNQSAAIKQYILDVSEEPIRDRDFWDLNKPGSGMSWAWNTDFLTWGFDIGYRVFGINTTFDAGWNNFVTASFAPVGGAELILQRKVYHDKSGATTGGMTVGIFAKRDYYAHNSGWETPLDYVNLYGGRGMLHLQYSDYMLHGFVSYGYSPQVETGIVNIGISFGGDIFK